MAVNWVARVRLTLADQLRQQRRPQLRQLPQLRPRPLRRPLRSRQQQRLLLRLFRSILRFLFSTSIAKAGSQIALSLSAYLPDYWDLVVENVPVVTDANGKDYRGFRFNWAEGTESHYSCSLTWENEMYMFGGKNQMRQISKLSGCGLTTEGTLSFNFNFGACASTIGNTN